MQNLLMAQTSFRQAIQRSLRSHDVDLTFEMLQIMVCLWKKDGVNQQELACSTFKDKASLSPLIRNLEAKRLIVRTSDSCDRRNKIVHLTDLGREYGQRVKPLLRAIYVHASQRMDQTHILRSIQYLQELSDVFKEQ